MLLRATSSFRPVPKIFVTPASSITDVTAFPGHAGRFWPLLGWRLVARNRGPGARLLASAVPCRRHRSACRCFWSHAAVRYSRPLETGDRLGTTLRQHFVEQGEVVDPAEVDRVEQLDGDRVVCRLL